MARSPLEEIIHTSYSEFTRETGEMIVALHTHTQTHRLNIIQQEAWRNAINDQEYKQLDSLREKIRFLYDHLSSPDFPLEMRI